MNDSGPAIARDADSGPSKNFGTEPPHNVPQTNEGVPNRVDDNITGDHLAKRRREQGDQTVAADEDVIDLLADEYHVPVTMALMTAQLNLPIMT